MSSVLIMGVITVFWIYQRKDFLKFANEIEKENIAREIKFQSDKKRKEEELRKILKQFEKEYMSNLMYLK